VLTCRLLWEDLGRRESRVGSAMVLVPEASPSMRAAMSRTVTDHTHHSGSVGVPSAGTISSAHGSSSAGMRASRDSRPMIRVPRLRLASTTGWTLSAAARLCARNQMGVFRGIHGFFNFGRRHQMDSSTDNSIGLLLYRGNTFARDHPHRWTRPQTVRRERRTRRRVLTTAALCLEFGAYVLSSSRCWTC
jgi:hypothetical protein